MMTYELTEVTGGSKVTFIHEDPRELDLIENTDDDPILTALRDVAEALANR